VGLSGTAHFPSAVIAARRRRFSRDKGSEQEQKDDYGQHGDRKLDGYERSESRLFPGKGNTLRYV